MFRFARFLSWILHPLLMPTYGTALLIHYNSYLRYSFSSLYINLVYVVIFGTTFLLPSIISYLLLKKGWIKSLEMDNREERTIPFITTSFCYCFAYYITSRMYLPPLFGLLILGATAAVIIATLINLQWKISIHMIGIGGITGALICMTQKIVQDLLPAIIVSIVAAGLLGSARLVLKSHNQSQIYAGFVIGMLTGCVMLLF